MSLGKMTSREEKPGLTQRKPSPSPLRPQRGAPEGLPITRGWGRPAGIAPGDGRMAPASGAGQHGGGRQWCALVGTTMARLNKNSLDNLILLEQGRARLLRRSEDQGKGTRPRWSITSACPRRVPRGTRSLLLPRVRGCSEP